MILFFHLIVVLNDVELPNEEFKSMLDEHREDSFEYVRIEEESLL